MVLSQLQNIDLVIILLYLIVLVVMGVILVRRVKGTEDYYTAGHTFGALVLTATVCATMIGGTGLMGRAGVAYSSGFKAVFTAIPYILGMFVFSGIAGRISQIGFTHKISSVPELFDRRFGHVNKIILSVMLALTMMGSIGSQITATGTVIKMLGSKIGLTYEMGAVIACIIFIAYTATSGLFGVVYTDVLQFFMLTIFVYIMIPIASLIQTGGIGNFVANVDPTLVKPYINGDILGDLVTYLVFTMAGAEMWQRAFAAKNGKAAKRGLFGGTLAYAISIAIMFFMGLIAHQIIGDNVLEQYGSTDAVIPAMAIAVLPAGLTGLALAGIISVIMSTADSYLLISVQTVVHDVGKVIWPKMKDKTEMWASRLCSVVLTVGALVIALYIHNAYNVLVFAWSFYAAACGLPCFAALFWKKATKQGIFCAMVAGFVVCVGWKLAGQPFGLGASVPGVIACAICLIVVSLLTYKEEDVVFLAPTMEKSIGVEAPVEEITKEA